MNIAVQTPKSNQLLLLTGCLEVSLWWNRATRPKTSWQYRWSSSNSSSIKVASKGSLFWINCSPKTISWSILLVFSVISCWKPYLENTRKIITSVTYPSSLSFVLIFLLTAVKEKQQLTLLSNFISQVSFHSRGPEVYFISNIIVPNKVALSTHVYINMTAVSWACGGSWYNSSANQRLFFCWVYTIFFSVAKKFFWLFGPPAYTTANLHPKTISSTRRKEHISR